MSDIKKSINEIKEYFNSHIDWKFYNYLIDKLTRFEDEGLEIFMDILVTYTEDDATRTYTIYKYKDGELNLNIRDDNISVFRNIVNRIITKGYILHHTFTIEIKNSNFMKLVDFNFSYKKASEFVKIIEDKCRITFYYGNTISIYRKKDDK